MKAATLEGMQACAEHGHRWAWRRTWHDVGFAECWRCGTTGPVGTDQPPPVTSGFPTSDEGAKTDMAKPAKAARRPAKRSPGRPKGSAKPERDAAILAAVAAGTPPREIAAAYGIHPTRVAQIRARARREDAERCAPCYAERCAPCFPETFQCNVSAKRSEERRGKETPLTPLSPGEGGPARAEHQQQSQQQSLGRAGTGAW